jgi:hypothetical protein
MFRIQITDEIGHGLEVTDFHHARVVITSRQRFPNLGGCLTDFEEAAHVAWSNFDGQVSKIYEEKVHFKVKTGP